MNPNNHLNAMKHRQKGGCQEPTPPSPEELASLEDPNSIVSHHHRWLSHLQQRNYSENTVTLYRQSNTSFLQWCQDRSLSNPNQVTKKILESYQRYLHHYRQTNGTLLAVSTQRKKLCTLKLYFDYLCRIDYLPANPASSLELPRKPKRSLPRALSRQTIKELLNVPDITTPLGIRERALIELLYATGIRRNELISIDLGDLKLDDQTLLVRQGKGGKDRLIPVAKAAIHWLQHYLEITRPQLLTKDDEQAFFLSGYGSRLTANYVGTWLSDQLKKINIHDYGSCHLLRHSCATHLVENGADIKVVQQLLGHENLETTGIYTEVAIRHLKKVYHKTHPSSQERSREISPEK